MHVHSEIVCLIRDQSLRTLQDQMCLDARRLIGDQLAMRYL